MVARACIRLGPDCSDGGIAVPGRSRCRAHGGNRAPFAGGTSRGFPPKDRRQILERDGYRCVLCGSSTQLQADHVVPAARGGSDQMENGRTLCKRDHLRLTGEQFGFGGSYRTGGRSSA